MRVMRKQSSTNTDHDIERLVQKNARGFTTTITRKMRRFFHGIGYHVTGKTTITTLDIDQVKLLASFWLARKVLSHTMAGDAGRGK